MVLLHILIAVASLGWSIVLFVAPTARRLTAQYVLIGMTLASGTYLVVSKPAHMVETCLMGLLYLGFVSVGTVVARRTLAAQTETTRR